MIKGSVIEYTIIEPCLGEFRVLENGLRTLYVAEQATIENRLEEVLAPHDRVHIIKSGEILSLGADESRRQLVRWQYARRFITQFHG